MIPMRDGIRLATDWTGGSAAFDVISMLGFVILAGLVVNNAILIVHQANNFRREGSADCAVIVVAHPGGNGASSLESRTGSHHQ